MKPTAALWRLVVSGIVEVILLIFIVNIIEQPVTGDQRSYTAEFTDASGLHVDADVRVRGVSVGKVRSIRLERKHGQSFASVNFMLVHRYGVVAATRLAIKYQALTGLRYIDVVNPAEGYSSAELVTQVPIAMTQPSYDITALFNGLQPVIATLSPEEINTFTTNAESYLSGDGGGLAPMLESIHKLTEFVSDRQQVVATLMRNLSQVAESIGGHSKDLVQILDWANRPLDGALKAIDEFRKSQLFGPDFTGSVLRLLANTGFPAVFGAASPFRLQPPPVTPPELPSDIDAGLDRAFANVDDYIDAFKFVPVMWGNIPEPPEEGTPLPCSRGRFELPAPMDIFVNGQKVVVCNR
ncbi:MlaD family protein [Mycobacterium parmense]|uniref:Putative Mce family protein n=1 Tax=Mycobacterium parmense TaxID=185642 RepID=A0A7I7YNC2_9MYCO|nr:MlaD family protein [Mycobacterium parmense]MCV7353618.1 MCE family protein [Mycobacterium parmense]ORW60111.1 mammalian cell entry protein [Mycobacterium parmense]BBZ43365.1 putative Mce family protein [Mycobacterium parmense]